MRNGLSNLMSRLMPNMIMKNFKMTDSRQKEPFKMTVLYGLVNGNGYYF